MKSINKNKFSFNKKSDRVAIIAPSSKADNYKEIVSKGLDFFSSKGINAFLAKESIGEHFIHANTIKKRLVCMLEVIEDDSVKIIWCLRGGSGGSEATYHLNQIHEEKIVNLSSNKILIGFSDITALHIFFNQKLNSLSIHGSMIADLVKTEENFDMILDLLSGKQIQVKLTPINFFGEEFIERNKALSAKICGGNLTVLCSNVGTNNHPKFDGKILFLEDINEPMYAINRLLFQLFSSNVINDKLKAIIFGDFTNCANADLAIKGFIEDYAYCIPCFKINDFGHGKKNIPIVFNSEESTMIGDVLTYGIESSFE